MIEEQSKENLGWKAFEHQYDISGHSSLIKPMELDIFQVIEEGTIVFWSSRGNCGLVAISRGL